MNTDRCPRCGSQWHTDCAEPEGVKPPNMKYIVIIGLLSLVALVVVLVLIAKAIAAVVP